MKLFTLLLIFFFPALLFSQLTNSQKVMVKLKNGENINNLVLQNLLKENKCISSKSLFPDKINKNIKLNSLSLVMGQYFFEFDSTIQIEKIINKLTETNIFEYVESDKIGIVGGVKSITPNDTYFSRQWGLNNNGSFNAQATADADVDMIEAWERTTGNTNTIVCVLDGGIKLDHPEFAGRVWINTNEIAANGIDDDNNGYIDDRNGWDWVNNDNNPTDDQGHGTNVTGIVGAKANNNLGYSGVNWNCKLMIGKITDLNGSGFYTSWISGIYYAVANGAKVINMSVGGSSFSQAMKDACDFAFNNNVTVVACMMNFNNNTTYYPAGFSSTIAVGATNTNDARVSPFPWSATSGSNYGTHIDVVAPGNYIYGLNYLSNTDYSYYWSGTSQATPLVSGVVSLMYGLDPNLTVTTIKSMLTSTAQDRVGPISEDIVGFDNYMGNGRINALAALSSNSLSLKLGILNGKIIDNKINLFWKTENEIHVSYFDIEYSTDLMQWLPIGKINSIANNNTIKQYNFVPNLQPNGTIYFRLKSIENNGNISISNICKIIASSNNEFKLKNNLVTNDLFLISNLSKEMKINYKITSLNGQTLISKYNSFGSGISSFEIKLNNLTNGIYFITLNNENNVSLQTIKFLKQ